jgi:hypothetical protein
MAGKLELELLELAFLDFHRENPRVYVLVCQFAQQAKQRAGKRR